MHDKNETKHESTVPIPGFNTSKGLDSWISAYDFCWIHSYCMLPLLIFRLFKGRSIHWGVANKNEKRQKQIQNTQKQTNNPCNAFRHTCSIGIRLQEVVGMMLRLSSAVLTQIICAMIWRECLGILIPSALPAASYIYRKLSSKKLSSITVSCLPNHTLNSATDFLLQSLCPFQLLTDFSWILNPKLSWYLCLFRYHQCVTLVRCIL